MEVFGTSSRIEIESGARLSPNGVYKAVVIGLPTPPLAVAIEGSDQIRDQFRSAIATLRKMAALPASFVSRQSSNRPSFS